MREETRFERVAYIGMFIGVLVLLYIAVVTSL